MRTIWKFAGQPGFTIEADMSACAKVVLVGRDPDSKEPAFWVETNKDKPVVSRRFKFIASGRDVPINSAHRGSAIVAPYVWHLYELADPK